MSFKKKEFSLTTYIPKIWKEFEQDLGQILGLPENISLRYKDYVDFFLQLELILPNQKRLLLAIGGWQKGSLEIDSKNKGFWIQKKLWFGSISRQEADISERFLLQSLLALRKIILRESKQNPQISKDIATLIQQHQAYHKIEDDYYRRIFSGVTGITANLRLGFRCNQDCHFCWQSRKWPDPPDELHFTWLKEMYQEGVTQVVFTGGEPTLFKGFVDLLLLAKEKYGMKTMVQTNATTLKNPRYLKRIQAAKVDRLFISFHSANAEISDRMTRAPKTFALTVEGIKRALQAGLRVGLNCVVEKDNYEGLIEQAEFIVEHFVKPFPNNPIESMNYSRPQHYFDEEKWRRQIVPLDLIYPHLKGAIEILREQQVLIDVTAGSCGLPACLLRFQTDLIYLPKKEDMGMADPEHSQAFREQTICATCTLFSRCQGAGKQYRELFGNRGLVPFTQPIEISHHFPLTL